MRMEEKMTPQNDPTFWDFIHSFFETTADKINAAISGAAIISPLFNLQATSDTAALWLPILGFVYLIIQIAHKLWHFGRVPKNNE